ncbi:hypothetical protein EPUL_005927, partial [Erysiphe pulchra]
MIRLDKDHEARKVDTFLVQQQIQKLIPDPSLVCDVWHAPSGIAILAPTPAKAAAILQFKDLIANRFGNATDCGKTGIVDDFYKPGLASIRDDIPIRQIAWTNKSKDSNDDIGHVRIHIPSHKAHKFPFRLQLFGLAVGIQRIQNRKSVPTCEKCFGFHSTRICAREYMCKLCGTKRHEGPCSKPRQCLNCKGPHDSEIFFCPARPQRRNGAFVHLSSDQLRHIRKAGHKL